jgi:hypothetical protein
MWCSRVVLYDFRTRKLKDDILLGISTHIGRDDLEEYFEACVKEDIENNSESNQKHGKNYRNNAEFVIKNAASWQRMKVWDEAKEFFDYEHTKSVRYEGFLVNHTQKLAVDLGDYYKKSLSMTENRILYAIDPIPALTETGGGINMALLDGMKSATTEKLAEEWCGDLLQIVNDLPDGYKCIDCCFADLWGRTRFCYTEYGVDEADFLLDQQGKRFVCCTLNLFGKRSLDGFMKVKLSDGTVHFSTLPVDQVDG